MKDILKKIKKVIDDNKGEDIQVIDVSKSSPICDYMIVCSVSNERHISAMGKKVENEFEKLNIKVRSKDGNGTRWYLIDANQIIVHVFHVDERGNYNLEGLWNVEPNKEVL